MRVQGVIATVISVVVLLGLLPSTVRSDCYDNNTSGTRDHCSSSYKKICYTKKTGNPSAICLTCSSLETYDCENCKCVLQTAYIALIVIAPVFTTILCVGCCCYYYRGCLWYRLRIAAEERRSSDVSALSALSAPNVNYGNIDQDDARGEG
mmetsp:Transcript_32926/g.53267  ORF Transcript_32926/g.53267 Transcript_32926/m.53267 type:complete len:151 (+) Transcript_32926:136-588(+)|eukprot:jgi/Bigna1/130224/aug1.10_g4932